MEATEASLACACAMRVQSPFRYLLHQAMKCTPLNRGVHSLKQTQTYERRQKNGRPQKWENGLDLMVWKAGKENVPGEDSPCRSRGAREEKGLHLRTCLGTCQS